jgi:hypothetical protein
MRTYDLNIKEVENKFIITIDKNQLNADYILNLMNWLQYVAFQPDELNQYLIKFQHKQQHKQFENKPQQRTWNYSGSVNLNNQLDNVNIRDFAYE